MEQKIEILHYFLRLLIQTDILIQNLSFKFQFQMQETRMNDTVREEAEVKPVKFQPIIPIPTIPKREYPVERCQEQLKQSFVFVSENNSSEQLEIYKRECKRLTAQNQELQMTLSRMYHEKSMLQNQVQSLHSEKSETEDKKKRFRRVANEINRNYICPGEKCGKSYGTDASLVQHIKIKHQEYYKTPEFQIFIEKTRNKGNTLAKKRQPLSVSMLNILNN